VQVKLQSNLVIRARTHSFAVETGCIGHSTQTYRACASGKKLDLCVVSNAPLLITKRFCAANATESVRCAQCDLTFTRVSALHVHDINVHQRGEAVTAGAHAGDTGNAKGEQIREKRKVTEITDEDVDDKLVKRR
jgi:hypothetical protein